MDFYYLVKVNYIYRVEYQASNYFSLDVFIEFFLYSCCVEHKCHRYSLDLIFTCVKPDYDKEDDRLGISHSVTHCCSLETAHVHRIRRARRKGRTKHGGRGRLRLRNRKLVREQEENKYRQSTRKMAENKYNDENICNGIKEIENKRGTKCICLFLQEQKETKAELGDKQHHCAVTVQAPPGVCNA